MPPSRRRLRALPSCVAALILAAAASPSIAQSVGGVVFNDVNGDGIQEAGEAGIDGATVTVTAPSGDLRATTAGGMFDMATTAGCHAVDVVLPGEPDPSQPLTGPAWRRSLPDGRTCPLNGSNPVGLRRFAFAPNLRANLQEPTFRYLSLGDSIAAGESFCVVFQRIDADYVEDVASAFTCLRGGAIALDQRAVSGSHAEDLLTDTASNGQFIPRVVAADPHVVTISIGGNDYLGVDFSNLQTRPFAAARLEEHLRELVAARRTVQESLSVLTSELPRTDVVINTVYDNEAGDCVSTDLHSASPPMWNQMLRHVAWGQVRPVGIAEVEPEFAHQDVTRTDCCGAPSMICTLDGIHPNANGARIIEHSVLEALGHADLGAGDIADFDVGFERLVAVLHPTIATPSGPAVGIPDDALTLDGSGASVPPAESLTLSGFTLPPGITPTRVIVGVRYRTTGTFVDDRQLFDASVLGFATPTWTFDGWDTVTPLVGGPGTAGNIGQPSVVNLLPNLPNWRDVSTTLTLNANDDGMVTGMYSWPAPTAADIARLEVRLQVIPAPLAAPVRDAGSVSWDGAWAFVYGTSSGAAPPDEISPPGSAQPLLVTKTPSGVRVSWGAEALSTTYRVYHGALGRWDGAVAEPGLAGGCVDAPQTSFDEDFPSDGGGNWFLLVAGVNSAGQGPLGNRSDGLPRTSAGSTCP